MFRIVRREPAGHEEGLPASLHPVVRRVYAARRITSAAELDNSLGRLLPFSLLGGIDRAAALLFAAIESDRRILVVGDFDADGATSCALALRALRALGAGKVGFLVPNRFRYGYGLTPEIVDVGVQQKPDLIITVDNGVSSVEGVARAAELGIAVIITDHHLPGERLPQAAAIVNPNLPENPFPSKNLAGVGVIFYVLLALRALMREANWFATKGIAEPNMADYLDLVALGTVADVVPLDQNNRILVQQGLRRIRAGRCCPGILALLQCAGRSQERLTAADLGFAVGPRLNAAGRLDDMSLGIACLLADERSKAAEMAARLDMLNQERRSIEADMQRQAMNSLSRLDLHESGALPAGLCLFQEDWHQGVIGILASRIKERFHRPVVAFAPAEDGFLKGSARSIAGVHVRDVLDAIAARHPGLLTRFGGHAMAAGLTLGAGAFSDFAAAFDEEVRRNVDDDMLSGVLHSDGPLADDDLGLELAEALREAGPWGQGFPEPIFDGEFELLTRRVVGEKHLKLVVRPLDGQRRLDAIAFNQADAAELREGELVHMAFRLDVNDYRGVRSPQLIVESLLPAAGA